MFRNPSPSATPSSSPPCLAPEVSSSPEPSPAEQHDRRRSGPPKAGIICLCAGLAAGAFWPLGASADRTSEAEQRAVTPEAAEPAELGRVDERAADGRTVFAADDVGERG